MGFKTQALALLLLSSPALGCISTKLLPHEDCDKFIQCSNGVPYVMSCAPGTLFDYQLQICNHAWAVTCSQPAQEDTTTTTTTTAPDSFLPYGCPASSHVHLLLPHEDCSKFYQCVHGSKVEMNCAAGTLFDVNLQVCNWPNQVTCSNQISTTTRPQVPSTTQKQTTTKSTTTVSTPQTTEKTTTTTPDTFLSNGCPASSHVHLLIPHEDCSKFYQCVHGNKVEMNCAAGTLFDVNLQVCNWPNQVTCSNQISSTISPEVSSTTQKQTTTKSTTVSTPQTTEETTTITADQFLSNGCPASSHVHLLLPHEDCSKFYQCVHGNKVEMNCAAGTLFDVNLQVCNWPNQVTCSQISTTTTRPQVSSTTAQQTTTESTTTVYTPTDVTDEPTTVSPNYNDTSEEYSTGSYEITTETSDSTTLEPDNSATTTETDSNEHADEPVDSTEETTKNEGFTTSKPESDPNSSETTTEADTEDFENESSEFETEETVTEDSIDQSTATTSPELNFETTTENIVPTTQAPICPTGFFGNVANSEDCSSYYLCSNGISIPLFCAAGNEFDAESGICVTATDGPCALSAESHEEKQEDLENNESNEIEGDVTEETSYEINKSDDETVTEITTNPTIPDETGSMETSEQESSHETNTSESIDDSSDKTTTEPSDWVDLPSKPNTNETENSEQELNSNEDTDSEDIFETTTKVTDAEAPLCPAGFFGNVANPNDCSSYTMCSNGIAIPLYCAEGCMFDLATGRCIVATEGPCALEHATDCSESNNCNETDTNDDNGENTLKPESSVTSTDSNETTINDDNETKETSDSEEQEVITSTSEPNSVESTLQSESAEQNTTEKENSDNLTTETNSSEVNEEIVVESTTPAPICPSGFFGNVANPEDCSSYFMCSNGIAIPLFCAEGYKYDSHTNQCIETTEGPCALPKIENGTNEAVAESSENNDTVEEKSVEDKSLEISTEPNNKEDTLEDKSEEIFTNEDEPSEIDAENSMESNEDIPAEIIEENSSQNVDSEESSLVDSEKETGEETREEIEEETEVEMEMTEAPLCAAGVFGNVPHPTLCDTYYMCSNGFPIQLYCPEGSEYNAGSEQCVEIAAGGCTLGEIDEESIEETTNVNNPDIDEDKDDLDDNKEDISGEDKESGETSTPAEDITNSIEDNQNPDETNPDNDSTPTIDDDEEDANDAPIDNDEEANDESLPAMDDDEIVDEPICPSGFFGSVANPNECHSYYMCTGGFAIQLFCADGSEFDLASQSCIPIAEGGCTHETIRHNNMDAVDDSNNKNPQNDVTLEEKDVSLEEKHVISEEKDVTVEEMCASGLTTVPHKYLENSYYLCAGGIAVQLYCDNGYIYEVEKDRASSLFSEVAKETSTPAEDITNSIEDNQNPEETNPDNDSTPTIDDDEEDANDAPIDNDEEANDESLPAMDVDDEFDEPICPSGFFGSVANPNECHSYYMCTGGFAIQLFCADGSEFDLASQSCIPIAEGGCTHETIRHNNMDAVDDSNNKNPQNDVTLEEKDVSLEEKHVISEEKDVTVEEMCASGLTTVPHKYLENSYYLCAGGIAVQLYCDNGYIYEVEKDGCVFAG